MSGAIQPVLSYGGTSGPPPDLWVLASGGLPTLWVGDPITDVVFFNADDVAVVTENGNGGYSTDGGVTWQAITGPIGGNITSAFQIYSNAAGTVGLCIGTDGTDRHIAMSTDQGASWTDVTPAGADIGFALFYSTTTDLFFFFDESGAEVWTSPDGVTWTATATGVDLGVNQNGTRYSASFQMAENGTDVVVQGFDDAVANWWVWRSIDCKNWTQVLNVPIVVSVTPSNVFWDGVSKFVTTARIGNNVLYYTSDTTGTTWTNTSTSSSGTVAPYGGMALTFNNVFFSAWDTTDDNSIANSPDGVLWTPEPITIPNWSSGEFMPDTDTPILYQVGTGVISSPGNGVWTQELDPLSVGFLQSCAVGFGKAVVVGEDLIGNGVVWRRS